MAFVPSLTAGSSSSLRSSPPPSFFYSPSAAHQSSNAALPRDTSSPSCSNSSPLAATSAARRIHQVSFVGKRGEQSALVSATMAAGAFADIDRTRGGAASLAHGRRPVVIGGVRAAALHAAAGSVQQEATGANSITAAEVAPEGQVADVGDSAVEAAAGAVGLVPGQTASAAGVSGGKRYRKPGAGRGGRGRGQEGRRDSPAGTNLSVRKELANAQSNYVTLMLRSLPSNDWSGALQVLESAEEDVSRGTKERLSAKAYNDCIMRLAYNERWRESLEVFRRMREAAAPGSAVPVRINSVLTACSNAGKLQPCLELLEEARKSDALEADAKSYTLCITACLGEARWEEALRLLREVQADERLQPTRRTYGAAIRVLGRGKKPNEALAVFREMQASAGFEVDGFSYSLIITALGQNGLPAKAHIVWKEMVESGVKPVLATYYAIIRALGSPRGGNLDEALAIFRGMPASGIPLEDLRSYMAMVSACADNGRWEEAFSLLRDMKEARVPRDPIVYGLVIKACGRGGQWEKAVAVVRRMAEEGVEPDSHNYAVAIDACKRAKEYQTAIELVNEMQEVGVAPSSVAYTTAIAACAKSGQWEPALALLQDIPKAGLAPSAMAYTAAISACGHGNQPEKALSLVREMNQIGLKPDPKCFSVTLNALKGDWEMSLALLAEMKLVDLRPSDRLYEKVFRACEEAGQMEQAEAVAKEMVVKPVAKGESATPVPADVGAGPKGEVEGTSTGAEGGA